MVNHCKNYRKKRSRQWTVPLQYTRDDEEIEFQLQDFRENTEEKIVTEDSLRILKEEIGKLPEDFREILTLRDIDGLSYNEIAEILGIKLSNVKVRIHRGREYLKNRLYARGLI